MEMQKSVNRVTEVATSLKEEIDLNRLPKHVAVIMDGNGRWAKEQGSNRIFGHQNGVESVRAVTEAAAELGIRYLTLYAFSRENWNRPQEEVNALMGLLLNALEEELPTLMKNNVRLLSIGQTEMLPDHLQKKMQSCQDKTANNTGLSLVLALSYSSRWEIARAARIVAEEVLRGEIEVSDINPEYFSKHLSTGEIPDPELMIRTSGELRISNFLLWQLAYTELYFSNVNWPDFRKEEFYKAIIEFQGRERRFGKTSEQLEND